MKWKIIISILVLAFLMIAAGVLTANDDDHNGNSREHHDEEYGDDYRESSRERHGEEYDDDFDDRVPAVSNQAYMDNCGACHFIYPPALLPAASWGRLLSNTDQHFGEDLAIDDSDITEITRYLTQNSAGRAPGEVSRDIAESVGSSVPLRITDVPEIRKEHRKILSSVLSRPSIGSLANCPACHRSASRGIFNDDDVAIPKN